MSGVSCVISIWQISSFHNIIEKQNNIKTGIKLMCNCWKLLYLLHVVESFNTWVFTEEEGSPMLHVVQTWQKATFKCYSVKQWNTNYLPSWNFTPSLFWFLNVYKIKVIWNNYFEVFSLNNMITISYIRVHYTFWKLMFKFERC